MVGIATEVGIILVAAALVGVFAVRLGQPTIIGYILTGVIIGPVGLGIVEPSILTETMAELGLAFLLFLLGIKMRIGDIRHLISPIVKISIPQMATIGLVGFGQSRTSQSGRLSSRRHLRLSSRGRLALTRPK